MFPGGPAKGCCVPADPLVDFRMMCFVAGVSFMRSVGLWSACAERVRQ